MPLLLSDLGTASYFLGITYGLAMLYAVGQFRSLHAKHPKRTTTKFLVLSLLMSCFLRCMSFTTICILDLDKINVNYASGPSGFEHDHSDEVVLYDKVRLCVGYVSLIVPQFGRPFLCFSTSQILL